MPSRTVARRSPESLSRLTLVRLVGVRRLDAGQVGVQATEDRDRAVVLADVELLLAPGVRHGDRPSRAGRGPRRTPARVWRDRKRAVAAARSGPPRGRRGRTRSRTATASGISARTGSSSPVSPAAVPAEEAAGIAGSASARLRSAAAPTSIGCWSSGTLRLVDDVGHDAGDVVGGAGVEAARTSSTAA